MRPFFCHKVIYAGVILGCISSFAIAGSLSGELKLWHKVTITFEGPETNETATPNPFLDYRLNVTFTRPGGTAMTVPGYYCGDGDAANTSSTSGNKWKVHLSPDEEGTWSYSVSFRTGSDIAVSEDEEAGSPVEFDGETGQFIIGPTDKTGRDFRGKGRLDYVGKHHLQFAGSGEYFLKCGADAPENLLAYADFDGDFASDGQKDNLVKTWQLHVQDWQPGDPAWQGDKGKGLIGAINYLASEGMNVFSFLPMNIGGDDRNVFPYLNYNERYRIDVSRMDQWEIVFEHADKLGMYLHFKTQETENELLLDGGDMGTQRKLYYRELIARFSHHLALNWNLGEEINNATTAQKKAWAQYFWDHDPYHHHIVIHNGSNHYDLMGPGSKLTGFSLQTNNVTFSSVHSRTLDYINRSVNEGKPWVVACDEPGDASHALVPDCDIDEWDPDRDNARKNGLWGNIMAGGAGLEWYFGYQHDHSDLTCQDFRSRDLWWDQCRIALNFFRDNNIPFWDMKSGDGLTANSNDYCFYKEGEIYLVYMKGGGETSITIEAEGNYGVRWFNPRKGGILQKGSAGSVAGGGTVNFGTPPGETDKDWVAVIKNNLIPADIDGDNDVDLDDMVVLSGQWLNCNDPADPGCEDVLPQMPPPDSSALPDADSPGVTELVHHWTFDEDTLAGATQAHDTEGGKDGIIRGASTVPGVYGNALNFDGENDDVKVDDFDTTDLKSMTISFWMNPADGTLPASSYKRIISGGDNWEAMIQTGTSNIANNFYQAGGSFVTGDIDLEEGQWNHVAVTSVLGTGAEPGRMEVYINGQLDNGGNYCDDDWAGGTFYFAWREGRGSQERFKGILDDVRIYNGVLNADEIKDIYDGVLNGNHRPVVSAGPDQQAFIRAEPITFQLTGYVSDDSLPEPPSLEWTWTVESSPGNSAVIFDSSEVSPLVTVDKAGSYTMRLTASDSELENYDEVTLEAIEVSCQYIIENGLLYSADVSGPAGESDCRVDIYDLVFLAKHWLMHE